MTPNSFSIMKRFTFFLSCLIGILFAHQTTLAQAPAGYTLCAIEGQSFTLPARSDVAYGANNQFIYLYNQTGTITFNRAFFGSDPAPNVRKSGYYKLVDARPFIAALSGAILNIKNHVIGTKILTPAQLNAEASIIQRNIPFIADTSSVVLQAFDLVDVYETQVGPIFINASTKNGFSNSLGATDGFELARAVFLVQQAILDYVYTPKSLAKYKSVLAGRQFKTADYFPGACPLPIDPKATYTAKINATMPKEYGKPTVYSSAPARRPTGYYLAPGSLGKVKVPASLLGKGFKILVGAHTFDRKDRNNCKRFFRVTNTFEITDTLTEIANPFGGGIYILTPYQTYEGMVNIELSNVVPAPFFSAKISDKTTLKNWLDVQRKNPAPWADFETDKFMMQVPRTWIYNYADPVTLMQDWDNRLDVVSKMLGYPPIRSNAFLYLQVDLEQQNDNYGIGNPQINLTYDPTEVANGNKNHWYLTPGPDFWFVEFHELGHAQLFSKFPGEEEAMVNLLATAIANQLYRIGIDSALSRSRHDIYYITRNQAAMNWMVTPNFRAGKPMDISNTTKDEVRYQYRGYAKYAEMAALFGWEMIDSFYRKEHLDFIAKTPGDGLTAVDSRFLRFSRTAGVDLRPLIHFWGVQPQNAVVLKTRIEAENLKPSKLICDRLTHYKAILPADSAAFLKHANAFFGGSIPAGGDPDYGSGWYNIWKTQYNSTHGTEGKQAMQNIIDLYFPGGCPAAAPVPTLTVANQSICPGQSATLTASGAMYYQWSNGNTGNSITVTPTTSTTFTVTGKTAGVSALPVTASVTIKPQPTVNLGADIALRQGQETTLSASAPGLTYVWSTGATTATIGVNAPGIYTVTVTNAAGCTASDTLVANTMIATRTSNQTEQFKLFITPNPTTGLVSVTCTGGSTSAVHVLDNLGRIIIMDKTFLKDGESRVLNVGLLPQGMYFIRVIGKDFFKTEPIIKQ